MAERMQRVKRHSPCPVCGKPDWCGVSGDLVVCMRVADGAIREAANGGWVHVLGGATPRRPALPEPEPEHVMIDPRVRHGIYNALLRQLPLRRHHLQQLRRRGLSEEQIGRLGYRTLPPEDERGKWSRAALAYRTGLAAELKPAGVPGFWIERGPRGGRWTVDGPAGLLIPVRSTDGQIVGCQIRVDNRGPGGKYRWLSSAGTVDRERPGGTPARALPHVARPTETQGDAIWITEGPLKADITALRLGCTVIAVPGVGNWRPVPGLVRELGAQRVVLAYDMDMWLNPQVMLHAEQLVAALREVRQYIPEADAEAPIALQWARWDGRRAKGIDDALVAGLEIELTQL